MRRKLDVLTTRGRACLAAGAVLIVAGVLLGVRDLTRIGVLATVLPLLAGYLTRRSRLGLRIERSVTPSRVRIDERSTVELAITNPDATTTPVIMAEEYLDYALGDRPRFVLPAMRRGDRRVLRYTVRSHARGRHRLGPVGIRVRDPFGLTARMATHTSHAELVVLPTVHPLTAGRARGSELGAEGSIPHMVALHGEDDVSIREYRDGDDLRRIHWPATARTGEIMVRQEDRPATRRAVVILDSRQSAFPGYAAAPAFEWAVSAAASIVGHLIDLGYAVHLLTSRDDNEAHVQQDVDADSALDTLAVVQPTPDEGFVDLVRGASVLTSGGGLVVLLAGPMGESQARQVAALRQPGSHGVAFVVTPPTTRGGAVRDQDAAAASAILGSAGWSSRVVHSDESVPDAWTQATGATVAGARR